MFGQTKLSRGELIWLGVIFWAVVFTAAEAPFSFTFNTRIQTWQLWTDAIVSIIFIADLIYHLRKFRKKRKARLNVTKSQKFKTYLFFAIDAIACIPFDIIFWAFGLAGASRVLKLIRLFRLVRIVKIFDILGNLAIIPRYIKIQMVGVGVLIAIHWVACIWIFIYPDLGELSRTDYYIKAFYWAVTTLTTVGYGDITPTTTGGRIYTMAVMMVGVGFYGVIIGNITRIMAEEARYKEQTKEKFAELSLFMKHYHIPERLQGAVFNYYNHLYSKRLSDNDQKIIGELPAALKGELQIYMNMKLIRNLPVFKYCSLPCLKEIAASLEQHNFGPHDNIIRIGDLGEEMFVIGHGIVDVSLADGNVVAQLHEGQFFGEAALLKETTRNANVRANTYCDLYKLNKDDFLRIIKSFPELLENMEEVTKRRASDK